MELTTVRLDGYRDEFLVGRQAGDLTVWQPRAYEDGSGFGVDSEEDAPGESWRLRSLTIFQSAAITRCFIHSLAGSLQ